jgi:hypothetical protein
VACQLVGFDTDIGYRLNPTQPTMNYLITV